jgi:hypothetical protein
MYPWKKQKAFGADDKSFLNITPLKILQHNKQ